MRILKTRTFARWMKKSDLSNESLCGAVKEMSDGLIDAILGGGLVKKRVALPGRGKRGGTRTIVATNLDDRWFFLYGFDKKDRSNIDQEELKALQELASHHLAIGDQEINDAIARGKFMEICNGN